MYVLECELVTPATIREAFAVFENPYNLAAITPPWLGFRILTQDLRMRKGANIDYSLRWLGIPMRWKTEITAYDPPGFFIDQAIQSPYTFWRHHHTFVETGRGTVVADRVEYALPLGPLGRMAHAAIVERQLRQIFSFRQKAIVQLLGGQATEVREPRVNWLKPDAIIQV